MNNSFATLFRRPHIILHFLSDIFLFYNLNSRFLFFIDCKSLFCVQQTNTELDQFSLMFIQTEVKIYFLLSLNKLHLVLYYYYLLNDTKIEIFRSKLMKNWGLKFYIELINPTWPTGKHGLIKQLIFLWL